MPRGLKYKSVKELEEAIEAYFEDCKGEVVKDKDDNPMLYKGRPVRAGARPPTVTGLAYFLGFRSRQALLNYQCRKTFHDAITRAKLRVEAYTEERLFDQGGVNGAKFSLTNNFSGWNEAGTKEQETGGVQIIDDVPAQEVNT
ncbi:MAG: hypothetical protein IJ313_01295 [Clostridia bacterium]|nr:hypothetical protein [Clostridia bacterium]